MHRADKRSEIATLIGLVLQVVFFGLFLVLFRQNNSPATLAMSWYFLAGTGLWLLIFIELYQRRAAWQQRNELEDLERQRLQRIGGSSSVFEQVSLDEELPAERRLKLIQRWFVPILSILTAGMLLLFAAMLFPQWKPITWMKDACDPGAKVRSQFTTLTIIALVSLACFVFSRYCLGLSRTRGWRVLRAGANFILGNSVAAFAVAVVLGFSAYGSPAPERVVAMIIPALMVVLALEIILNLVLDIYRPRIPGEEYQASYESRLLGLFSEPEGVLHSIAQTIDYQFGFKVSETWFYQLFQQAVVPLILFGAATLYLMSAIVIVQPGQQAIVTHFGKKPAAPLREGLHLKWPWPIDEATIYNVGQVNQMAIGFTGKSEWEDPTKPILWTVQHVKDGKEFQLLVASKNGELAETDSAPATGPADRGAQGRLSPVNILAGELVIYYNIKNEDANGLLDYVSNYRNPDGIISGKGGSEKSILESVAYRQWTQYMASVDPMTVMTTERDKATAALTKAIQGELDARQSGIQIVRVSMIGMHPPVEIAPAYESAINARQERETMVWRAKGDASERVPAARAKARQTVSEAEAGRYAKVTLEKARAERFNDQLLSYRTAPNVFFYRNYLDIFQQSTANVRKFILAVEHPEKVKIIVDDKEKLSPGMMGLGEEALDELNKNR